MTLLGLLSKLAAEVESDRIGSATGSATARVFRTPFPCPELFGESRFIG
ncbi:MAG TPA: hypothetical protein VEV17_11265 [Bryobacteraceae bacterium]|nr:hypothetical protein [Bryobacteraceae bacterium]